MATVAVQVMATPLLDEGPMITTTRTHKTVPDAIFPVSTTTAVTTLAPASQEPPQSSKEPKQEEFVVPSCQRPLFPMPYPVSHEELLSCVTRGDLKALNAFIPEGPYYRVNEVRLGHGGWTLILEAVHREHAAVLSFLLKRGFNPNLSDDMGHTPLWWASSHGWFRGVQLLLEGGADPNLASKTGSTPLLIASNDGHSDVSVSSSRNSSRSSSASHGRGSRHSAKPIVYLTISFNSIILPSQSQVVCALLQHPEIDVNHKNVYGYSALQLAMRYEHKQVEALLLNKGAIPPPGPKQANQVSSGSNSSDTFPLHSHRELLAILVADSLSPPPMFPFSHFSPSSKRPRTRTVTLTL